jgi:hypothetical protein
MSNLTIRERDSLGPASFAWGSARLFPILDADDIDLVARLLRAVPPSARAGVKARADAIARRLGLRRSAWKDGGAAFAGDREESREEDRVRERQLLADAMEAARPGVALPGRDCVETVDALAGHLEDLHTGDPETLAMRRGLAAALRGQASYVRLMRARLPPA